MDPLLLAALSVLGKMLPQIKNSAEKSWQERNQKKEENRFRDRLRSLPTKELRVLGFPNSGKTQFLNALRCKPHSKDKVQTVGVPDCKFVFAPKEGDWTGQIHDSNTIRIVAKDLNGAKEYLIDNIGSFVNDADILLFMCNIVDYLVDNNSCRRSVNSVLRAIQERSLGKRYLKICIILTYEDMLPTIGKTSEQAIAEFKDILKRTPYGEYPCYAINTCDQIAVRNLFRKILGYGK